MGACWSHGIESVTPYTGFNSKNVSRDRNGMSSSSGKFSSASMPMTPRSEDEIFQGCNLKNFLFRELKMATKNFRPDSVLGEGGFGSVFRGWIDENTLKATKPGNGVMIAVKRLNQQGLQGHKEWLAEINYLGKLHHPNLVKLMGHCIEDEHRLLIYENSCLTETWKVIFLEPLTWRIRMKVALGAAKGLAFLHNIESKVIYRDFKTSNILLDSDYNVKLSDFGLARDGPVGNQSHVSSSSRVVGTVGYAAPEYIATGDLTFKSDVYSFGVVLLEMLSSQRSVDKSRPSGQHYLVQWAKPYLASKRKIFRVLDKCLEGQYSPDQARKAANLALECLAMEPRNRPIMTDVVKALEELQEPPT